MSQKTISDVINVLEDKELVTAVIDIENWNKGKSLPEDSTVRQVIKEGKDTVCHSTLALNIAKSGILEKAAHRFVEMFGATCI